MKNLKTIRQNENLSQSDVAKKLGLSLRGYQDIENGVHETSVANLIKLADLFGCSVDYLVGHQAQGIVHIESLNNDQQKLLELIKKLSPEAAKFLVGYVSRMIENE